MLNLSFPNYEFTLKEINQKRFIFDEIRKKYIELTPEEWVRQNCIKFLINEKKFKKNLIFSIGIRSLPALIYCVCKSP